MRPRLLDTTRWTLRAATGTARGGGRRSVSARSASPLPPEFLPDGAEIASVSEVKPKANALRGEGPASLEVEVDAPENGGVVLVVRHASGALTFHAPVSSEHRGAARGRATRNVLRFNIPVPRSGNGRRGLVSSAIKLILVKVKAAVLDKLTAAAIKVVGRKVEQAAWKKKKLAEGLFRVTVKAGALALEPADAANIKTGRSLLFLHGTFSDTRAAFGALAQGTDDLFASLRGIYGDRIYAFEHFTVSRTPLENASALLRALPARPSSFDVITHSRGGLVLRSMCELQQQLGAEAVRFRLGTAVLVASPNAGTPLATPDRWEHTMGLLATLLEALPDNPLTTAAEFIANGITWLAKHVLADLPGLASMDENGRVIGDLQTVSGPVSGTYCALAANHEPDDGLWKRLVDAGIDAFFQGANDMVVPSEGSWVVDAPGSVIPSERIGCFGPGGNITASSGAAVHHLNFFLQPETHRFIRRCLGMEEWDLPSLDPSTSLPTRRSRGGVKLIGVGAQRREAGVDTARVATTRTDDRDPRQALQQGPSHLGATLHLLILSTERAPAGVTGRAARADGTGTPKPFTIIASYDGATVIEEFKTRNAQDHSAGAGARFASIIARHKDIRSILDGEAVDRSGKVRSMPDPKQLREFGGHLFEALFTGSVRRLYDVARSRQRGRPLNVIFTCTVPWVAELPWEFAFDPSRGKFLATEEVHFIRNVITAVPSQVIDPSSRKLRVLLVPAQPKDMIGLALDEEEMRVRAGFKRLQEQGLVEVEVLPNATPADLHLTIEQRPRFDIVHFMGHAEFDSEVDQGRLLLLNRDGGYHEVDITSLRGILCERGIHLVFLNACDTGRDSLQATNQGVAQSLVQAGIPGVVANQYKVLDSAAVTFSERFYLSLASGGSFGEAAREARIALNYQLDGDVIDWAVPVLYTQDPDYRLVPGIARKPVRWSPTGAPARMAGSDAERSPVAGRLRVGVSDLARQFVNLERALENFNRAQNVFFFETVDPTVPLGVWQLTGETRYLLAPEFAKRMKGQFRSLGVAFLLCSTDHVMRAPDAKGRLQDQYSWCSRDREVPIALFSTNKQKLPPSGPQAGRVAANAIAEGLAGCIIGPYVADYKHSRGPTSCPLHGSKDSRKYILDRLTFDATCRKLLTKHGPKDFGATALLDALEQILRVYDADGA